MLTSVESAVGRARELSASGTRVILGITGMPGAGKSTLAERVADALDGAAVCVPMDGFHLAGRELARLGRSQRKGAPDTFDAAGYAALLGRLRAAAHDAITVYAPFFDRGLEEPIAGAIPVPPDVPLVITEGNYLLLDAEWASVRHLLDETWYVEVPEEVRLARLIDRHVAFGKSEEEARRWALGSDQANAELIAAAAHRADMIVRPGLSRLGQLS